MGTRAWTTALALLVAATPAIAQDRTSDRQQAAANEEIARRTKMIVPGISSYRFADTAEPAIWLDVVWIGRDLDKTAREVRGDLLFYDLSGRLRFGLAVDLQRPITRNDAVTQTGIGIRYDASRVDHRWMRSTPVSAMLIDFRVKRLLYEDGELLEY